MARLASVTTLWQRLQNVVHTVQGTGKHSLINWLMSTVRTMRADPGELPETKSRWTTYLNLVQIIQETGMQQMTFRAQYTSPNEELFTTHVKDLIVTSGLASTFGTMVAQLAPCVDRRIYKVTTTMARLENVEVKLKECSIRVCAVPPEALPDWPVHRWRHG